MRLWHRLISGRATKSWSKARRPARRFRGPLFEIFDSRCLLATLINTGTAADVIYTLPTTSDAVFLEDDGGSGNSMLQLRSGSGKFDTTVFANPGGSLTINSGNSSDSITLSSLPDFNANVVLGSSSAPFASISVNGTIALSSGMSFTAYAVAQAVTATGSLATSGGGTLQLTADSLDVNSAGTLNAGTGVVVLAPLSSGQAVILGAVANSTLSLTDAELDRIVAGTLRIGDKTNGGAITLAGPINVANNTSPILTLRLLSHGAVINNVSGQTAITVANLAVEAFSGSGTTTTLTTKVSNMAASYMGTGTGDLKVSNTGPLTVAAVDGIVTFGTDSGNLNLTAIGALTVNVAMSSRNGLMQLTAAGNDQLLTIATNVSVEGMADCSLIADKMLIQGSVNFPSGTVTLMPESAADAGDAINLGSKSDVTANTLELSNAEIGLVTTKTLQIGDSSSGTITFSANITTPAGTNVKVASGSSINLAAGAINTGGGNVSLSPGSTGSVTAGTTGADAYLESSDTIGTLTFASGSDLSFALNGTVVDSQFQQLNVSGKVDVTGVDLVLSGSYTPLFNPGGSFFRFVIINNDGSDPVVGTFNGLPEGKVFVAPGFKYYQISYVGGDGNDVVVTASQSGRVLHGTPGDDVFVLMKNVNGGVDVTENGLLVNNYVGQSGLYFHGLDGNDTLILDYQNGNPIPGSVDFHGNTIGDKVIVRGASAEVPFTEIDNHIVTGLGTRNGYLVFFRNGKFGYEDGSLYYDGIGSIDLSGNTINELFLGGGGVNNAFLEDDGTPGNGISQVRGSNDQIATTLFSNATAFVWLFTAPNVTVNDLPDYTNSLRIGSATSRTPLAVLAGAETLGAGKSLSVNATTFNVLDTGSLAAGDLANVTISADDVSVSEAASLLAGTANLSIFPWTASRPISVGMETTGQLSLTDAELDRVTAKTLQIGNSNSGDITINGSITRAAPTDISLASAGNINFATGSLDTGGGNLMLTAGALGAIYVPKAGNDVIAGTSGTLSLAAGSNLGIGITGEEVDTEYDQLHVAANVDLTGMNLVPTLGFQPMAGDMFTVVNNVGSGTTAGQFSNVPDQTLVINTDKYSAILVVNYQGGDGNDVVLTVLNVAPTLNPISDPPPIDEDADVQTIGLTGISAGDAASNVLAISAISSSPSLIPNPSSIYSAIDGTASLSFQPLANQFGTATITVIVKDNGGTVSGGVDTFSRAFTVTVAPVNDLPSFEHLAGNYSAYDENAEHEPAAQQVVADWATKISVGPANESDQTPSFEVTNDNSGLFTAGGQPAVDADGNVTYTPMPNTHGTAHVTVVLHDSGESSNTASAVTFDIGVVKFRRLHNAAETGKRNGLDVTGSTSPEPNGFIVSEDVVAVINYINAHPGTAAVQSDTRFGPPYVDVNGDDNVAADDVLKIINWINAHPGQSEAESASAVGATYTTTDVPISAGTAIYSETQSPDFLALLATDVATATIKRRRSSS